MKKWALFPILLFALALVGVQLLTHAFQVEFYLTQLTMSAYYSIVVMGLCLVMGYAGQISLGHAAFFALGGYTSAVLTSKDFSGLAATACGKVLAGFGWLVTRPDLYGGQLITFHPWLAFAIAVVFTGLVAVLIGYPALRLKGHYLAMATLGFGLIVYRGVLGPEFTGGADGLTGVPPWPLCPGLVISCKPEYRVENFYVAWGVTLLVLWVLINVVRSRVGRALRSIHDGELAAGAMGVNTARLKLQAFVFSALLAAVAGSFFTHYSGGIGPSEAGAMKSVRYVALVAAGGMANLWGGLIVSTILTFLSLRGCFGTLDHAVFGAILIAIISLTPEGPLQPIAQGIRRLFKPAAPPEKESPHGAA